MTILSNYSEKTYSCNGITKTFTIPWKFFDDEIMIYKNKSFSTYVKDEDYTIINNGDGGEVTFKEAPAKDTFITITRGIPLYQLIKFLEGEDFPAEDYEYSLDRIYMALQDFYARLERCVTIVPGGETFEEVFSSFLRLNYQAQGQTYWREDYEYSAMELTRYNGYWWISLYNKNKGNTPGDESSYWSKFSIYDSYSTSELDNLLRAKADSINVYTKDESDDLFGLKADKSNVYSKSEIDNMIGDIETRLSEV